GDRRRSIGKRSPEARSAGRLNLHSYHLRELKPALPLNDSAVVEFMFRAQMDAPTVAPCSSCARSGGATAIMIAAMRADFLIVGYLNVQLRDRRHPPSRRRDTSCGREDRIRHARIRGRARFVS